MSAFDPYYHWLSIPVKEQPANHYRLLGIELFEDDVEVITNAANRQMRHVRSQQSLGDHVSTAQLILHELAGAKACLLDARAKSAYDRQLKAQVSPLPGGQLVHESPRQPLEQNAANVIRTTVALRKRRHSYGVGYWVGHGIGAVMGLGIAYLILTRLPQWNKPLSQPSPDAAVVRKPIRQTNSLPPGAAPAKQEPITPDDPRRLAMGHTPPRRLTRVGHRPTPVRTDTSSSHVAQRVIDPLEVLDRLPRYLPIAANEQTDTIQVASFDGLADIQLDFDVATTPSGKFTASPSSPTTPDVAMSWIVMDDSGRAVATVIQRANALWFRRASEVSKASLDELSLTAFCFHLGGQSRIVLLCKPLTSRPPRLSRMDVVAIPLQTPASVRHHLKYEVAGSSLPSAFAREPANGELGMGQAYAFCAGADDDARVEITIRSKLDDDSLELSLAGTYFLDRRHGYPLDPDRLKKHFDGITQNLAEKSQEFQARQQLAVQLVNDLRRVATARVANPAQGAARAAAISAIRTKNQVNSQRLSDLNRQLPKIQRDHQAIQKLKQWTDSLSFEEQFDFRVYLPIEAHGEVIKLDLVTTRADPATETASGSSLQGTPDSRAATVKVWSASDEAKTREGRTSAPGGDNSAATTVTGHSNKSTTENLPQHERLLIQARAAMASHDHRVRESAEELLRRAADLSPSPEYANRVEQLQLLNYYVMGFWEAVEDGIELIEDSELVVNGERMYVVDVNDSHIIIRRAGANRRAPRNDLPAGLALAIADRWFDAGEPSAKVFRGAFYAISSVYGAPMARQEWLAASRQGLADEVQELIALLGSWEE